MSKEKYVKNYYQGIYLTETIMGNPNGDFVDNSPRNFDGKVFTTDKCIKYNIRKYIHDTVENIDNENKKNVVFFYPRLIDDAEVGDAKYLTRDAIFKKLFNNNFEELKNNSPDVRMFGGTFSFSNDSKQIYGPIQLSYGIDINDAEIKRLQIGSPFSTENGKQKTTGSEAVVDDAIISYDITINPNVHPNLLLEEDLDLFKKSLWYGTNLRKSTSKKTDSKMLILIKFKNNENSSKNVTAISMGELKELISIKNKDAHKKGEKKIKINANNLNKKLEKYKDYIDSVEIYYDSDEIEIELKSVNIQIKDPTELMS